MAAPLIRYCEIFIEIPTASSLKEKRGFLKGPIERIRHKLNLAIIEHEELDVWNAATLACVSLSSSESVLANTFVEAIKELESSPGLLVKDWTEENL